MLQGKRQLSVEIKVRVCYKLMCQSLLKDYYKPKLGFSARLLQGKRLLQVRVRSCYKVELKNVRGNTLNVRVCYTLGLVIR